MPEDVTAMALQRLPGDLPQRVSRERLGHISQAAVLVPLVRHPGGLTVLLTRRAEHLKHHPGQISFPGGRLEPGDSDHAAAALRESEEEVGLSPQAVEVVGYLDPYLTITGYAVVPVVGFLRPGLELRLDATEVVEAFEVPLAYVLDSRNHRRQNRPLLGVEVTYYEIHYGERNIWGATAGMLVNFSRKLDAAQRGDGGQVEAQRG